MDGRKRLEIGLIFIFATVAMGAAVLIRPPEPSRFGRIVSISSNVSGRGLIHTTTAIVYLEDGRRILAPYPTEAKNCRIGQRVELSNEGMRTLINSNSCEVK
jgi:uncharacterized OB-fold protein